eukprot:TRINITY_DN15482_c0_g1_i1.p1 TRINITY_DN15482_c0_g1~~TRINITY_DN15482_c0_g1_i1.p1  ORF type:complete len:815 (+),score=124.40 TRINITY_DN15482_c0_g1_i1:178-2622(+)
MVLIGLLLLGSCTYSFSGFGIVSGAGIDSLTTTIVLAGVINASIMVSHLLCAVFLTVPVEWVATSFCLLWSQALLFTDFVSAAELRIRCWSVIVLIMDISLVLALPERVNVIVVVATLLSLLVERVESAVQFGLYELLQSDAAQVCDCQTPPCARKLADAMSGWAVMASVFFVDFLITRSFAKDSRRQLEQIKQTVALSSSVTVALSRYEVDNAEGLLEAVEADLPPQLLAALLSLVQNLRSYKQFLPDSVLVHDDDSSEEDHHHTPNISIVEPPGVGGDEKVAIAFTDIQSSTALWESHPQGMFDGLRQHNTVLRMVATMWQGYEVKIIGDAFMLAFATAIQACSFALGSQEELVNAEWPLDLVQHRLCRKVVLESGQVIWHGPRIRIGLHYGPVRAEKNPVTGRCDYFGPVVNVAARIEAVLKDGGLIGVTNAILEAAGTELFTLASKPTVSLLGTRELKGVRTSVEIHIMLPQALSGRLEWLREPSSTMKVMGSNARIRRFSRTMDSSVVLFPDRAVSGSDGETECSDPAGLCLKLRRSVLSCVCVRGQLSDPFHLEAELSSLLVIVEHTADLTQGVVASVLSANCIVAWNASRPCVDHVEQCFHFLSRAQARGPSSHAGAATGTGLHGNLAGHRRRYATVVSSSVETAMSLAEAAELGGDLALVVGSIRDYCLSVDSADWAHVISRRDARDVAVGAFRLQKKEDSGKWDAVLEASQCGADQVRDLEELFTQAVLSGDFAALRSTAADGHAGAVRVLLRLDSTPARILRLPESHDLPQVAPPFSEYMEPPRDCVVRVPQRTGSPECIVTLE